MQNTWKNSVDKFGHFLPFGLAQHIHNNFIVPALLLSVSVHLAVLFAHHVSAPEVSLQAEKISVYLAQPAPAAPPVRQPRPKQAIALTKPAVTTPIQPAQPVTPAPAQPEPEAAPETPAQNALPASTTKIERISNLTRAPAPLEKIEPAYPPAQRRAGVQAFVLAEIVIDASGKVRDIHILKSGGEDFDNSVIETLKKSVFTPGYIGDNAVSVRVSIPFRFKLN